MPATLQSALQDHFSSTLPEAACASVDGIPVMGFADGVADSAMEGALELVQAWLRDALNASLIPSKEELLAMAAKVFDEQVATRPPLAGRPWMTKAARFFFLYAVGLAYDQIVGKLPVGEAG